MEYFDQFPGEDITPAGGVSSDPEKAEEELDEMIRQQQEQQAAPQEEQQPASADTIDNPISQWMEDRNVDLRDLVDNVFQGDQRSREEIAEDRREVRLGAAEQAQELQERMDRREEEGGIGRVDLPQVTTPEINVAGVKILPEFTTPDGIDINPNRVLGETTRAVAGGVAGVVEHICPVYSEHPGTGSNLQPGHRREQDCYW